MLQNKIQFEKENGRVYNPITARFLSPDPFVQNPTFSQDYNRYTYVNNNPMLFTDPSGYMAQGSGHNPYWMSTATQVAQGHGNWNEQFGKNRDYINYDAFGINQFLGGGGGGEKK